MSVCSAIMQRRDGGFRFTGATEQGSFKAAEAALFSSFQHSADPAEGGLRNGGSNLLHDIQSSGSSSNREVCILLIGRFFECTELLTEAKHRYCAESHRGYEPSLWLPLAISVLPSKIESPKYLLNTEHVCSMLWYCLFAPPPLPTIS